MWFYGVVSHEGKLHAVEYSVTPAQAYSDEDPIIHYSLLESFNGDEAFEKLFASYPSHSKATFLAQLQGDVSKGMTIGSCRLSEIGSQEPARGCENPSLQLLCALLPFDEVRI